MRIKNTEIYRLIAELWNAGDDPWNPREMDWCVESARAEVRASGMTPDDALREAVHGVCALCRRLWAELDDALDDDDDVVYEEDDDGDGDYVEDDEEEE